MKIRKATKKDFGRLVELIRIEYGKSPYNEKWTKGSGLKTLRYYLKIGGEIYTAEIDKRVVGFIISRGEYYNKGISTIVEELVVERRFQGKGIGKALLKRVEDNSKKAKINEIYLTTSKKAPAFKFYKKLGYVPAKYTVYMKKRLK